MGASFSLVNIQASFLAGFVVSLFFTVLLAQPKQSESHVPRRCELELLLRHTLLVWGEPELSSC